jgi:uncharacterized membrane protein YdjX (TVP38/TMEM64 family)
MGATWLQAGVHGMQAIQGAGWIGWILFVGLYAATCLLFIPGSILTLGAGAVYGFWLGTLLVLIGNGLGALLSLLLTRYLLRQWMTRLLRRFERLRAVEHAVEEDGWKIVCLARLSPVMPYSLINYALGLTKISVAEFLFATEIGAIPSTALYVYLGKLAGNLSRLGHDLHHDRPLEWVVQGCGLVLTVLITIYITRKASQALRKRIPAGKKSSSASSSHKKQPA